jgi:hypothetical protein
VSDAAELLSALAEEARLRVFAAVVLGCRTTAAVVERTAVKERDALQALVSLESAGLVRRAADGWAACPEVLREAVIAGVEPRTYVDHGTSDATTAAVLRVFMPHGRLERMPSSRSKRLVVLDQVVRVFEPGVRYPERDVNALLKAFHPDYVTIRRHLVDEAFLAREAGVYWRIGGTVDVDREVPDGA